MTTTTDKRISLHRRVSRDTMRLLRLLSKQLALSQGETLDRAVQALAVAESFGGKHLKLSREPDEATKILTGEGNTIQRTERYLRHLESQKRLEAQRGRMTTLDAIGAPITVDITIPTELIDIAKTYPAIDWNEMMQYAVDGSRSGEHLAGGTYHGETLYSDRAGKRGKASLEVVRAGEPQCPECKHRYPAHSLLCSVNVAALRCQSRSGGGE